MSEFVNQLKAEKLARFYLERYVDACNCQSVDDARLAVQKMLAVAVDAFNTVHDENVTIERVTHDA